MRAGSGWVRPSGRAAVVVAEESPEALAASNDADLCSGTGLGIDQDVPDPLVTSLVKIMKLVLPERAVEGRRAEKDHLAQPCAPLSMPTPRHCASWCPRCILAKRSQESLQGARDCGEQPGVVEPYRCRCGGKVRRHRVDWSSCGSVSSTPNTGSRPREVPLRSGK
jgi:hypothetical protein